MPLVYIVTIWLEAVARVYPLGAVPAFTVLLPTFTITCRLFSRPLVSISRCSTVICLLVGVFLR